MKSNKLNINDSDNEISHDNSSLNDDSDSSEDGTHSSITPLEDDIVVGQDEDEEYYISRKALQDQIWNA